MNKEKKVTENEVTIETIQNHINEYLQQDYPKEVLLKIEPQILDLKNVRLSSFFAEKVPNSQISDHQAIVMQYGSFGDQINFALNVDGADISLIGQNIVKKYKNTNPSYIYDFLNDIDVEPIEAIDYMVAVWDKLNEEQRTTLYDMYVDNRDEDKIFHQLLAIKKGNEASQQVDEISNLIRTYQNQSKKA